MKTKQYLSAFLALAGIVLFTYSCEREWDNPWDEKATLDPDAWAPQNLQITDVSITEKKLTWTYGDENIEGFKIDRKVGNENWQLAYATVGKEIRSWNDSQITPNPGLTCSYRLKAFAGQYNSSFQEKSKTVSFPPPGNLQIEKLTEKSYKLSWTDNIIGEQGYKIDRKVEAGNWQSSYGIVVENQTTFIDTNVFYKSGSAINIEYMVYSYYQNYGSGKASINTNAELTAPSNPMIVQNNITTVTLTWQDNSNGEDGFKIERKYEGGNWAPLTTVTANTYTDNDFELNIQVYYRICAYSGTFYSSYLESEFDATIPAPSNLEITENSITSITLNWQDNSNGEDGFKIERKYEGSNWTPLTTVTANNYIDYDFDLNTQVYYRIYAFSDSYSSAYIEMDFNSSIPAPSNLLISQNSITSVTLTWQDNSNGEDGFKIERKNGTGNWAPLTTVTANNYIDYNFDLNTQVYYRIYAFSGSYASSYIEKDFNSSIPAPSNLLITPNSHTSVTLTWLDNSNGEEGFKLDRQVNDGSWDIEFATLNPNQTSFTDNSVVWQANKYTYRSYAFSGLYNSYSVQSTISCEVSTSPATDITITTAKSGGYISKLGNYSIIARGVCYGTSPNPDLSGPHIPSGSGAGAFISNITGLTPGIQYNVCAYATTDFGTIYGQDIIFNTIGLGDIYAGGIIFYLDGTEGGLVCAESDQSTSAEWGCLGTFIGCTATGIGTGPANTAAIVSSCSESGIAARTCNDLVLNSYSDWFLPSLDELNLMYINLKQNGLGGFEDYFYWSSSEGNSTGARGQNFGNGIQMSWQKDYGHRVRAVRAFNY